MKERNTIPYSKVALGIITILFSCKVLADIDQLQQIDVIGDITQTPKGQPSLVTKTRDTIQQEMITDTKDLVRYISDVGINDNGRYSKGFAIRGVEGNRVGISIDGVSLPDSEENSLYSRYGAFNPSRLNIDPELVQGIDITRGSNSFYAGSGAVGGGVNYRTLEAYDLVKDGNNFGGYLRGAYASKNSEWIRTTGIAYMNDKFDAILLYSQRTGHELKSNGHGDNYTQSSSQHPDPSTHRYNSYLAKFGYQFLPNHRLTFSINGQQGHSYTEENSYSLYSGAWRDADDDGKRTNVNIHYIYTPEAYLSLARLDFNYQKTDLATISYRGTTNVNTNQRSLGNIYDRRMQTTYKRLGLQLESMPFPLGGTHTLAFNSSISQRDFKNINYDTLFTNNDPPSQSIYTIQYPIRTIQYHLALKDDIHWNKIFTNQFGLSYDHAILKPQELNAACSTACLAEGKRSETHFNNLSYFANFDAQFNNIWKLGYHLSSGYRIPTASELFFTYTNAYGTWHSNPNLRPETSLTHNLIIEAKNEKSQLAINLYRSDYRHFLLEQESLIEKTEDNHTWQTPEQQMVNINKAHIQGIEVSGSMRLSKLFPISDNWEISGTLGYSKGKLSNGESLLSIQPLKTVLGLDYENADKTWGIFSRLTYLGGKKAKDAKTSETKERCLSWKENAHWRDYGEGEQYTCAKTELYKDITTYKYLNKSAWVFDLFGYYKPTENITLRAGVYNLFNREYFTWDALRGINAHSTTNTVDRNGYGLERYKAPGRNFSAAIEIKF